MSCIHCVNWMRQMSSVKRNSHNLIKGSIRKYSYTRVLNKTAQQILILACLPSMWLIFAVLIILQDVTVHWKHWVNAHVTRKPNHSRWKKRTSAIWGKGIENETENVIMLLCCNFSYTTLYTCSNILLQFEHRSSENMYHNKKIYRSRQWDNQR